MAEGGTIWNASSNVVGKELTDRPKSVTPSTHSTLGTHGTPGTLHLPGPGFGT